MTTSQKFAEATTETITAAMAALRDETLDEEIELGKMLTAQGVKNPLIKAHIITTFGAGDETPSPTPKVNPNFPGPRPQA